MDSKTFYTNSINKKFTTISGKDKLKGELFTKLIEQTNEMIDNTNTNKDNILKNIKK